MNLQKAWAALSESSSVAIVSRFAALLNPSPKLIADAVKLAATM